MQGGGRKMANLREFGEGKWDSAKQQLSVEFRILKIGSVLTKLEFITYRYPGRLDFAWELR